MRLIRVFAALILFLALPFCGAAPAYGASSNQSRTVRIAEFSNSTAAQLLLMTLNRSLSGITEPLPLWDTLSSETPDELANLTRASVTAEFDMILTGNDGVVRSIFEQGLVKIFFTIFSEEIILVGPVKSGYSGMSAQEAMKKINSERAPFFTLMRNEWSLRAEFDIWNKIETDSPGENKNYVESSRDDVTALHQAEDEGAFLLVGEGAFAQYLDSIRYDPPLEKIAGSGTYKKCYVCVLKGSGFRKDREAIAGGIAAWLRSPEAQELIESFQIGDIKPFHPELPLR
jgi:ABC-type tungstate transport system permease subunit